jgi:hypothetical protein
MAEAPVLIYGFEFERAMLHLVKPRVAYSLELLQEGVIENLAGRATPEEIESLREQCRNDFPNNLSEVKRSWRTRHASGSIDLKSRPRY